MSITFQPAQFPSIKADKRENPFKTGVDLLAEVAGNPSVTNALALTIVKKWVEQRPVMHKPEAA